MTQEENIFLAKRNIVDSIWKEANIEGVVATFPETKEIFEGRTINGFSVDDTIVINNLKHAWEFILSTISVPIDIRYIKQVNSEIGAGIVYKAGALREGVVNIGGTTWKPDIPDYDNFKNTIENITNNYEQEEKALKLFTTICRNQPFNDGNKRTAQIVANKSLIEEGRGVLSIPVEEKKHFEELLIDFYESNNDTKLNEFLKKECIFSTDKERDISKTLDKTLDNEEEHTF